MLTPALSSKTISPTSASPVPPGIGDSAMATRTKEKATRASRNVSPSTLNTTEEVHIHVKPAAKVLAEAVKMRAHRVRNNLTKSSRISIEKASGCVRSTAPRTFGKRAGTFRNRYERTEPVKRPTAENIVEDRRASHQNTIDTAIRGMPTATANVCSRAAVPPSTDPINNRLGRPHVVKDGTTAVAIIEDAIVRWAIFHVVNIGMRIPVPTAPPPRTIP